MDIKSIKIGNRFVGHGYPTYVIAEIGSNFDGSIHKAKKLIKIAKQSGADAAKFQSFKTELLLSKNGFNTKDAFQSRWPKSVWQTYKDAELPREWHKELNQYCKKIGIDFFASPWDFEAVDLLSKLNVPAFKIGSGDITFDELLIHIGKKQKPILLATGASNVDEISHALNVLKSTGNKKIILLHSVVQYPSSINQANINAMINLQNRFRLNVGYSDHSPGFTVALASVALGASVIEKHFTLSQKDKGPDHPHSMEPDSFRNMVQEIRLIEQALGDGIKIPQPEEKETRIIQRRSIWSIKQIKKGEKFTRENIMVLRPAIGISADKFFRLLEKRAQKNYPEYSIISKNEI